MDNDKDGKGGALIIGGALGAVTTYLLARRPVEAAPPEARWNYLIELAEAQVALMEQLVAAMGVAPPGVEIAIQTQWKAKTPEQIYSYAIRTAPDTFYSNKMVDWTEGKRFLVKVESSLNQPCVIQVIGNYVDDMNSATDIGDPEDCVAHGNISIGLAWDDWHPFIGVRITTVAPAPGAGILNIWSVIQE